MVKVDKFMEQDNRVRKVYSYAKKKYCKVGLPQHNWQHVLRDLYRALVIAKDETSKDKKINYSILISAVLLHDIGATEGDYGKHTEKGPEIIRRDLPNFGFEEEEINKIAHCVKVHKKNKNQESEEAKILFDSDHLEKSGVAGIPRSYYARLEIGMPLDKWIKERSKKGKSNEDFFTKKAKEMSGNGFEEYRKHFQRVLKCKKRRKDWKIKEEDLWE